jgi:hypothetical protein
MSRGDYNFQEESAAKRLAASATAKSLVAEALSVLGSAGVRNNKVKNALLAAQAELARFKRSTKFAINKRRERNKECRPSIS